MLTFSTDDKAAHFAVEFIGETDDNRPIYRWAITVGGRIVIAQPGSEIRGGCRTVADEYEGLRTLASFLDAWHEAHRYEGSENRDLFPESLFDLLDGPGYVEEFSMAVMDRGE